MREIAIGRVASAIRKFMRGTPINTSSQSDQRFAFAILAKAKLRRCVDKQQKLTIVYVYVSGCHDQVSMK